MRKVIKLKSIHQCIYLSTSQPEVESRTQGSKPMPRAQKNPRLRSRIHAPRTDCLEAKGKIARCQGQGPRTLRGSVSKKKGLCQKLSQIFRKLQAISKKEGLRPLICKFSTKFERQKIYSQVLWRAPRRNYISHDVRTFSSGQKIVLSSSRGQEIFEFLQGSRRRPKT